MYKLGIITDRIYDLDQLNRISNINMNLKIIYLLFDL